MPPCKKEVTNLPKRTNNMRNCSDTESKKAKTIDTKIKKFLCSAAMRYIYQFSYSVKRIIKY